MCILINRYRKYFRWSSSTLFSETLLLNVYIDRLQKSGGQKIDLLSLLLSKFSCNCAYLYLLPIQTQAMKFRIFRFFNKKLLYYLLPFCTYNLCHLYTGGNHEGATAIVDSIITVLILQFIHKLPCGLKCVHSLLGK